ncbi:PREDICTED: carbonyl reductase [NADPH] 1-like [Priapulus caudatus]|uniref:carbonyl reductase (NADPH) n=1 Tax=Priapulus caudatus TaxID=37621 RepID=A0ABM1DT92_PRICU|nr:PREDICTED: carbonyl reductase [NADPH] 1-like [Priapulus caudatus]
MARRVAVVTGSNKGIGLGVVRGLCKQFDGDVYLTARDEKRGTDAVAELQREGLSPKFHLLDISDHASIERLRDFLKQQYGGLDVLVNNAGIAYKNSSTASAAEQAENTMAVNFFANLNVCKTMFDILKPHARVVNVSSVAGLLQRLSNPEMKKKIASNEYNIPQLEQIAKQYVEDVKAGVHAEKGYPKSHYSMTKLLLTALSRVQARELQNRNQDIVLNACCPGYVSTDMSSHGGTKTIDEGADTLIYLALLPPNVNSPIGEFVENRKISDWTA